LKGRDREQIVQRGKAETLELQNGDGIPRAGKCFDRFPGEFLDDAAGRRISGLAVDIKAMLPSFAHELAALTLKMSN